MSREVTMVSMHLSRRLGLDYAYMLEALSMCTKVSNDQRKSNGLKWIRLDELKYKLWEEHIVPRNEIDGMLTCLRTMGYIDIDGNPKRVCLTLFGQDEIQK